MKKRNFYMVQVDVTYGDGVKFNYLPYTVGLIAANALQNEIVKEKYTLSGFIFIREEVEAVVARLDNPFLVGFCNYVWNTRYNKQLAQRIKEVYPDCIILFGGHNVPDGDVCLKDFSYIDYLIHGEGEIPFQKLLLALLEKEPNLSCVPGLSYRDTQVKGGAKTNPSMLHEDLSVLPSPYLTGLFDHFNTLYPDYHFSAVIETNRGCPYHCAFCDWTAQKAKIRLFPLERVYAELRWLSEQRVEFVWGGDANFGILPRDEEIVDYYIRLKKGSGYPQVLRVNYAKNNEDRVFRIVKKLHQNGLTKYGATLSFQSLSDQVLQNIGRKNLDYSYYKKLMERYNNENIRTYSELILCLPGETYQSYTEGFGKLLQAGQHNGIEYYRCIVLPNSLMSSPDYRQKHGIQTKMIRVTQWHTDKNAQEGECDEVIVATNTMSSQDWVRAQVFSIIVQAMHGYGLLRFFALYLFHEKHISYEVFYNRFIQYCEGLNSGLLFEVYRTVKECHEKAITHQVIGAFVVEETGLLRRFPDEYVYLKAIHRKDEFYEQVESFLRSYAIEESVYLQMLHFQKEMMKTPGVTQKDIYCSYNFYEYFCNIYSDNYHPLEKKESIYRFREEESPGQWNEFAKVIAWYGRFGGKALFSKLVTNE